MKNNVKRVPPILGHVLPYVYFSLIVGGSFTVSAWTFNLLKAYTGPVLPAFIIPWIYIFSYVLIAGLLARPHVQAIIPGRFKRTLHDPVYSHRRLYGLCWTSVYYFTPLYWVVLSVPVLKTLCFRLFGYQGQMDFTLYPDTWIRDLPLLELGRGAYISNRATLGTNIVLTNNILSVDKISIKERCIVGHLTMLAPGVDIGSRSQVGVGCAIGAKVSIGKNTMISPACMINHGATLGDKVKVLPGALIGLKSEVADGMTIPPLSKVADGVIIAEPSQDEQSPGATGKKVDLGLIDKQRHISACQRA